MGNNISSTFFNDILLNYQSVHVLKPAYTIKISPTKWLAISTGLSSNREPTTTTNTLVILDNMTFYNIELLSTKEPIDEYVYREIYCNFKGRPMYTWGNVFKNTKLGLREKHRNPNYEGVRQLRGNQSKPLYGV